MKINQQLLMIKKVKSRKKKSKNKSRPQLEPGMVAPEEISQDDGEKFIQIGGIYGYNQEAKSYHQFRYEQYCAIQVLEESRRRNLRR
jgi:hypothetical protein